MLAFQRLDVYRCAVRFLGLSTALASRLPRGHAELADQLKRASLSIPLNVAEGSGKTGRDGSRYYVIARGSAMECAAILDAMVALELIDGDEVIEERELVERMVAMLTKMRGEAGVRGGSWGETGGEREVRGGGVGGMVEGGRGSSGVMSTRWRSKARVSASATAVTTMTRVEGDSDHVGPATTATATVSTTTTTTTTTTTMAMAMAMAMARATAIT